MNEHRAVDALEGLGLTSYEAKVFIALQRLGSGGARDVARVCDVPRPQVYSTAESLEEQGLIDVQHSDPIRYRPVSIEEARTKLRNRFERTQETAFDYIECVRSEGPGDEQQEDVWTISGRETISVRIVHLIREAEREVVFGVQSASIVQEETEAALRRAATDGVSVSVISRDPAMRDRFDDAAGVEVVEPAIEEHEATSGRLLVVDRSTVLLSVFTDDAADGTTDVTEDTTDATSELSETAIWSSETTFARVLVRLVRGYLQTP